MNQNSGIIAPWPYTVALLDDADPRSAANLNTGPFGGLSRTLNIDRRLAAMQAQNWGEELLAVNSRFMQAMKWAPNLRKWVIAVIETVGTPHFTAYVGDASDTGGANWVSIGDTIATSYNVNDIVQVHGSSTKFVAAVARAGTEVDLMVLDTAGANTWASNWVLPNAGTVKLASMPGPIEIAAAGGTDAGDSLILYSTDLGATWTPIVTWGVTVPEWCLAASDSAAIAVPRVVQASPQYVTSANGSSWTTRSFPSAVVNSTDRVAGVVYGVDPIDGLSYVYLMVNKGYSGAGPYPAVLYRSRDGVTWGQLGSIPQAGNATYIVGSLAFANGMLMAQNTTDSQTTSSRPAFSYDGGSTWYQVPADLSSNVSPGASYTRATITASPYRFSMFNSFFFRASLACGLPTDPL